ncbi:MAG TPA: tetratricopeptide repeat protein [Pyrinomonadaceae bacterium]|jgi:TolA-binding protein
MNTLRFLLVLVLVSVSFATRAAAQEEARAAWQVTRFDITANTGAAASATGDRALTVRANLSARNIGQGVGRTFTVRLNPSVEIKSATVGDAAAQFTTRAEARTKLQQVTVTLPNGVASGGAVNVSLDYSLPVGENSGLAAISGEGAQFLPLSHWYPTPNTEFAPRGADTAPVRLTVNAASGETVVSTGQVTGAAFEQALHAQPFFVTGKWDTIEGAGDARGVSAWLVSGASAEERQQGESLIALAAAARSFYAGLLGAAPDAPVRLVTVRRGAGFDMAGTLLLDAAVFRRSKTDAATALLIAEALARLWIGGATGVQSEGAGVVREGLSRYLATLFLEKQFGRDVADAERMRMASAYAAVARRDAPLAQSTPFVDTYFASVTNKGAMAWRLVAERIVGRDAFMNTLRRELETNRGGKISLASLRAALGERTDEGVRRALEGIFNQPTDTDLIVGLPQQRAGEWVSALRNIGSIDTTVSVVATTQSGERVTAQATVPAKDFGEARFKTAGQITRVEVDPEKLYPQLDYANDIAPRAPSTEELLAEAVRQFAQQKYALSEQAARSILQRTPQSQEARTWLGRALLEQNRLDDAEKEFRAVVALPLPTAATLAWANIGLGEIAMQRRQTAEAIKRFDEAARTEGDYASALAARAARIRAESTATPPRTLDESARNFVTQLDAAIQSGRKVGIDALIVPGELNDFVRGLVSNQPESWQTRVLRTEPLGTQRMAVDVSVNAKILGREHAGTAVLLLARTPAGWRLLALPIFEVKQKADA